MRKLLLTTLILLCLPLVAVARECFWQPGGGSGTACTDPDLGGTACTLATALAQCSTSGDTYTGLSGSQVETSTVTISTTNATFKCKDRHQCIIDRPAAASGINNTPILATTANGITVTGIHFKCHDYISLTQMHNQRKINIASDDSTATYNILEECAFGGDGASDRNVYRYNYIFNAGSESTYFKNNANTNPLNFEDNVFEYNIIKGGARTEDDPGWGGSQIDLRTGDGWTLRYNILVDRNETSEQRENNINFWYQNNLTFEKNIIKNITDNAFSLFANFSIAGNNSVQNNAIEDITVLTGGRIIWWKNEGYALANTVVDNNDFCDAPDFICEHGTSCSTDAPVSISGLSVPTQDGLPEDAADSICDTTIDTILQEAADAGAEIGGLPTPQLSVGEVGSIDGTSLILDLAVTNWPLGTTLDDIIACDDTRLTVTGSTSEAISTTGCVVVDADTVDVTLASEPVAGETITVQALSRFVQMDTSFGEVAADGGIDLYSIAGASIEATNNLVSAEQPKIDSGTSISSGVALQ